MAATPLLGDYNCEEVVVTFKGIKTGVVITPTQFGAEQRVTIGERVLAEDIEGQGGGAVVSHQHSRLADKTITLLPTDEANSQFDQAAKDRERFEVTVVDNSGTAKYKGIAWLRAVAGWDKGRVAAEVTWTFRTWVQDMQHGQTAIIATG